LKRYRVLYIDPPWYYYGGYNSRRIKIRPPYPTMKFEELATLPIQEIADDDCALFMWVTGPQMNQAIHLIERWGFHFTTVAFVWIKTNCKANTIKYTIANWTMANAEYLLFAKKGHPKRYRADVKQILFAPLGKLHSAKPPIVRDRIVDLVKDGPRLEVFARTKAPGWDAIGNEIDGLDIRIALSNIINQVQAA